MDISANSNILDKVKINISQSGQDITNSMEIFTDNLNKMNNIMNQKNNSLNNEQNLKTSSDIEPLKESSSITTSFNKLNMKIKPNIPSRNKIADPVSDIQLKKLQQKIDSLKYENFVLNKKNKELNKKNEDLIFKINSDIQNNKKEMMKLNELLSLDKINLKQKDEEIVKLKEKLNNLEVNKNDFSQKNQENIELIKENEKLKINQKKLYETITNLEKDLKLYKNELNKVNSEYSMAKEDKMKELMSKNIYYKKNDELNEENEYLKNEINKLKNDNDQLSKKIRDNANKNQLEYQKELDNEKEMMENKLKEQLEKIYDEQRVIMDLKIKTLEEKNEDLKYKIQELKKDKNKSADNDLIIEEIKKQNASLKDESSCLKLQIQLKQSENDRLNKIYKENINLIGELNTENNRLKEKINLLSNKLKEVSTNNITEMTEARNKIALLSSKAQSYDEQDNTFDKIFSEILLDDENTNSNKNEESKNMISAINQMPQGYNKRISQYKFMASRLKKLYEEKSVLNAKLENLEIENKKFKEQSNIFKNMEQNNNESYEYLIKELEKKDSELLYYKEVANDREIRFKQVMKENENINAKCNALEKDLKQILENRDKINKLDFLVGKIVENQKKFFGNEAFNQPSGKKSSNNKGGKNQLFKSNKVKYK